MRFVYPDRANLSDALRRALLTFEDPERKIQAGKHWTSSLSALCSRALDGDEDAIAGIGNRLHGKS